MDVRTIDPAPLQDASEEVGGASRNRRRSWSSFAELPRRPLLALCVLLFVFLAVVAFLVYRLHNAQAATAVEVAPELTALIHGQERIVLAFLTAVVATALVGLAALILFESPRYSGPIHKLLQIMHGVSVRQGAARVHFRRGDHLSELELAFNTMMHKLEARTNARSDEAARVAAQLRRAAEEAGGGLGADLHLLADDVERLRDDLLRP